MDGIDISTWDPSTAFRAVDIAGVVANGLLGGILARSLRFDIVGFVVLGIISGLGGGMIRDVLLQQGFPVALTDPLYLTGALLGAAIAYLIPVKGRWSDRTLELFDVLAIGAWSATGAQKAIGAGLGLLPAVMLGVVTAVGGGLTRDVFVGRTPQIFGGNPMSATPAVLGALIAGLAFQLRYPNVGMALSILTVSALGLTARYRHWMLPLAPEWKAPTRLRMRRRVNPAHPEGHPLEGPPTRPDLHGSNVATSGSTSAEVDTAGGEHSPGTTDEPAPR